ncbi:Fc receptor-like protein 2 [Acanthopagrus schlegelii]
MTGSTCNIKTDSSSDAVYWCESESGEFSNAVNITVQDGDMILLSPARPVTEGHSVSLSCRLKRRKFDSIVFFYHNEKVIQNDSRWELNISAVSKSDEGFYKCRHSGRESAQSWMSVQANRPKAELRADDRDIPVGGSVTLTCSVKPSSSDWKYFWYRGEKTSEPLTSQLSAGPIRVSEGGVYWCRGGRGEPVYYTEFSDPVTIYKISPNKAVVTLQPNWTEVYRGERITLRCEITDGGDTEWEYEWRTTSSEKPPDQNKHSITSVTRSHSGDYRCKGRKNHTQHSSTGWSDPIKLTVSDAVSRPDSSSFPVLLVVGLVCGIVLVIPLLVLFCYRASKDTCFKSLVQSESSNTDHVVNLDETECSEYSSPPHDAGGSQDVTYSTVQIKCVGKKGKQQTAEERSVYSEVRTRAADDNLLYSQVVIHNKYKKKKGQSAPAAADESVYSEVKPGSSLGL